MMNVQFLLLGVETYARLNFLVLIDGPEVINYRLKKDPAV